MSERIVTGAKKNQDVKLRNGDNDAQPHDEQGGHRFAGAHITVSHQKNQHQGENKSGIRRIMPSIIRTKEKGDQPTDHPGDDGGDAFRFHVTHHTSGNQKDAVDVKKKDRPCHTPTFCLSFALRAMARRRLPLRRTGNPLHFMAVFSTMEATLWTWSY